MRHELGIIMVTVGIAGVCWAVVSLVRGAPVVGDQRQTTKGS